MAVEPTHALICFNDSKSFMRDGGQTFARELADTLRKDNIRADIKGYSESSLDADTYQWLIFICEPEATQPPMDKVINEACNRTVQRRMRNVLAVTIAPHDLPPTWASIRKYDVSVPATKVEVLKSIRRDMGYVKIPFTQIQGTRPRIPSLQGKLLSPRGLMFVALALLLIIVGTALTVTNHYSSIENATAKATAKVIMANALATQTARQKIEAATAIPQTRYDQFFKTGTHPNIPNFNSKDQWSAPDAMVATPPAKDPCKLDNDNHTFKATVNTKNQYIPCLATPPNFANFALQVDMQITGDAGGIIFRSDNAGQQYYRVSLLTNKQNNPTTDFLTVYACNNDCTDAGKSIPVVGNGTPLIDPKNLNHNDHGLSVSVDPNKPITLSIIVQGNNFDIYINGKFETSVTDPASIASQGQIGVYAASLGNSTTVTFSNLKVWTLQASSAPTPPATPVPTPMPTQISIPAPTPPN